MAGPQRLPFYVARTFGFPVLANCISCRRILGPNFGPKPRNIGRCGMRRDVLSTLQRDGRPANYLAQTYMLSFECDRHHSQPFLNQQRSSCEGRSTKPSYLPECPADESWSQISHLPVGFRLTVQRRTQISSAQTEIPEKWSAANARACAGHEQPAPQNEFHAIRRCADPAAAGHRHRPQATGKHPAHQPRGAHAPGRRARRFTGHQR